MKSLQSLETSHTALPPRHRHIPEHLSSTTPLWEPQI